MSLNRRRTALLVPGLISGLLLGCATTRVGDPPPGMAVRVRAPAVAGAVARVRVRDLFRAVPSWGHRRAFDGDTERAAVGLLRNGHAVACQVTGRSDGRVEPEDELRSEVSDISPSSPWVAWRVVSPPAELPCVRVGRHRAGGRTVRGRVRIEAAQSEPSPEERIGWRSVEWVAVAPRDLLPALEPLAHLRRSQGTSTLVLDAGAVYARYGHGEASAEAIRAALTDVAASAPRLRWVLLAGDVEEQGKPRVGGWVPVPTFYRDKVTYRGVRRVATYPTDEPYAQPGPGSERRLAVGRIPARTAGELAGVVRKIVTYEVSAGEGTWRRRLAVFAGPANFGAVQDAIIEATATHLLDTRVPYDFDLKFLFAKLESPYAYPFDQLGQRVVHDLEEGALFAAYIGHGLYDSFDSVYFRGNAYPIGRRTELDRVRIGPGKPFFLSFTCDTGGFDRPDGARSIAESLVMNPEGPVAVFASSRESHPYPNALYAQAFIQRFLERRPRTIGEGISEVKARLRGQRMLLAEVMVHADVEALKQEHLGLYNLLGDPATRLQYPGQVRVTMPGTGWGGGGIPPQSALEVTVASQHVRDGAAIVTVETERRTIRGELVPPGRLKAMTRTQDVFAAMAENHRLASDKVVSRTAIAVRDGMARLTLAAPDAPGRYVVKVLVQGEGRVEAGHVKVEVGRPTVSAR